MTPSSQEIMTLTDLANYLKVAEKTVVRMAREGKIPGPRWPVNGGLCAARWMNGWSTGWSPI